MAHGVAKSRGEKWAVARHRGMAASGADALERAIESRDRQAGRQACEDGLAEYEAECSEVAS